MGGTRAGCTVGLLGVPSLAITAFIFFISEASSFHLSPELLDDDEDELSELGDTRAFDLADFVRDVLSRGLSTALLCL